MSSSSIDPSNLTVDKLRKELVEHDIPIPKEYTKKEALVELYRKHILQGSRAPRTSGHEFEYSSEEEEDSVKTSRSRKIVSTMSKRRSMTSKMREELIISSSGVNVSNMTDAELADNLLKHGADVGPITEHTRIVYEKKLLKLLDGQSRGGTTKVASPVKKREEERLTVRQDERVNPVKIQQEERYRSRITQYSDEDDEYERRGVAYEQHNHDTNVDDEEEENEVEREEPVTRYERQDEKYEPFESLRQRTFIESTGSGRSPLSSVGQSGDHNYFGTPYSSKTATTTTRRTEFVSQYQSPSSTSSHLLTSSAFLLKDSGAGIKFGNRSHESKASKCGKKGCLVLVVIGLIAGFLLVVVIWNMDAAFSNPAIMPAPAAKNITY